jgi:hypothetical protein
MSHKKPHPIVNKLMHSVRNRRIWRLRVEKDRKKEQKKVNG